MVFESLLDPVFNPLLSLAPLWGLFIISLVISLIIVIAYKFMTDQNLMKILKEEIKSLQKEMKAFKHDPKKVMEMQKRAMEKNMKYMMHSMKPTLITFVPIILIFGWLNAHLAYNPITPGQEFTTSVLFKAGAEGSADVVVQEGMEVVGNATQPIIDGVATFRLKGTDGEHVIQYKYKEKMYDKDVLITQEKKYSQPTEALKDDLYVSSINVEMEKVRPFGSLSLFGWRPGWLGTYIIFSLVFSMALRKIMKVY